ncbi:uncharacterized protein SPAPADRAFT_60365 [Spathaspora passalidarum NRRL Y-27907]|uniref:Reduced meiotic recombination protein 1 n=1 Tax=Spathaspora passalidarum (strain NRRL Y-27907 / 11-Y1) TaxID=619300 RepID=G3AL04_SPAPN|nr:uncharacterized protein SPAPADRAFT_60365 [Spathaspora passalidarum NRRL Y-27907]EGW33047.1 hypothetical protein SPAPADRAFT_60365 [Spathaspora passalidarum NRRL Y-27907]
MFGDTNENSNRSSTADQTIQTGDPEGLIDITSPVSGIDETSDTSNYITNSSIDRRTNNDYVNLLDDYEEDIENLDQEYKSDVAEENTGVREQDDVDESGEISLSSGPQQKDYKITNVLVGTNVERLDDENQGESSEVNAINDEGNDTSGQDENQEKEEEEEEEEEEEKTEEEVEGKSEGSNKKAEVVVNEVALSAESDDESGTSTNGDHTKEIISIKSESPSEETSPTQTEQSNKPNFEHIPVVLNLSDTEFLLFPINQEKCKIDCSHLVALYDSAQIQQLSIELFFQFLRSNEDLSEIFKLTNADEILLEIPELEKLEISEDNVYCKDITIRDFIEIFVRLCEGTEDQNKIPKSLNFNLRTKTRFISKFNHLVEVAGESGGFESIKKRKSDDTEEQENKRSKLSI